MSVSSVMALVAHELRFVAPASFGAPGKDLNLAPPRYVWVPRDDVFARGATGSGVNARQLHSRDATLWAVIYGRDYEEAEMLQAALFTALRKVLQGANYVPGKGVWPLEQWGHHGVVCRQEIMLRSLPLYRTKLPQAGPAPQPAPPDQYETVAPTSVAVDETDITNLPPP
jgi:hypothetical protein